MHALISPAHMTLAMECEDLFGTACPQTHPDDPQPHICIIPVDSRSDRHPGSHRCDCGATG
jgi:hypothetical protein